MKTNVSNDMFFVKRSEKEKKTVGDKATKGMYQAKEWVVVMVVSGRRRREGGGTGEEIIT